MEGGNEREDQEEGLWGHANERGGCGRGERVVGEMSGDEQEGGGARKMRSKVWEGCMGGYGVRAMLAVEEPEADGQ